MRRRVSLVAVLAVLGGLLLLDTAGWALPAGASTPVVRGGHGLHVNAVRAVTPREINVNVSSAALGKPVDVRVLVPRGYAAHPAVRYPTLYLYAGTGEHAGDWTTYGDIQKLTAHRDLIVVMPDVGFGIGDGWFSNWLDRGTSLGPNQWETFQIRQLIPWVDANFRTRADRGSRAVAGLSQGGFGSMVAAARHPDLFVSAAAFSGAVDIAYGGVTKPLYESFPLGTTIADFVPPFSVFGNPLHHQVNWQGHDPTTLVRNLRGMDVHLYTGTGLPGPYDKPQWIPLGAIEALAHSESHTMYRHALQTHVPMTLTDYGAGTHSWPYWIHDMRSYLPEIMRVFGRRWSAPAHVSYDATAPRWTQWGWRVVDRRPVREQFTHLRRAGRDGFTLRGHGVARVTTPPFYSVDSAVKAVLHSRGQASTRTLTPNRAGRITMRVSLPARVSLSPRAQRMRR